MKVYCPYCGKEAELIDSSVIYGRSYGMAYICFDCDAYVGTHKGTEKPLGRLANAELRKWKMRAHDAFDPIWKSRKMSRKKAYSWLAEKLKLPEEKTHIGMFDIGMCKKVIEICLEMIDMDDPEDWEG